MVIETIKGEVTGKPLISLWRHFPLVDNDPMRLAETTIKEQQKLPSDIVKLSPHGRFPIADFGCKIKFGNTDFGGSGSASCVECVIKDPSDWSTLERISALEGELGKQLKFVEKVSQELSDVPKMMTLFSPTMIARKISGNNFPVHLFESEYSKEVVSAVDRISDVVKEFGKACLDAGVEGLFIAIQEADKSIRSKENELQEMIKLNCKAYSDLYQAAEFTVLHLHGQNTLFKSAVDELSADAVNWHDSHNDPSLLEAAKIFKGGLFGGISPDLILKGNINLQDLKDLKNSIPLILAPECVLWQGTEDRYLFDLVKKYRGL